MPSLLIWGEGKSAKFCGVKMDGTFKKLLQAKKESSDRRKTSYITAMFIITGR